MTEKETHSAQALFFKILADLVAEKGSKIFADGPQLKALLTDVSPDPMTAVYRELIVELVTLGSIVQLIRDAHSPLGLTPDGVGTLIGDIHRETDFPRPLIQASLFNIAQILGFDCPDLVEDALSIHSDDGSAENGDEQAVPTDSKDESAAGISMTTKDDADAVSQSIVHYLTRPQESERIDEMLGFSFPDVRDDSNLTRARGFVDRFTRHFASDSSADRVRFAGLVYQRLSNLEQKPFQRTPQRDTSGYVRKCLAEYIADQTPSTLDPGLRSALVRDMEYGPLPLTAGLTLIWDRLPMNVKSDQLKPHAEGEVLAQAPQHTPSAPQSPDDTAYQTADDSLSDEEAQSFGRFFIILTIAFVLAYLLI